MITIFLSAFIFIIVIAAIMLGATYGMQRRITKAQQRYADELGVEVVVVKKRSKEKRNRKIPASTRKAVLNRDDHSCTRCGQKSELTIDHIFPFSKGGGHELENLRVLCKRCNELKSDALF